MFFFSHSATKPVQTGSEMLPTDSDRENSLAEMKKAENCEGL